MRLKTLRKERPAFENEGAIISGSRMDISNNEVKPSKYRTNNSFALPTSLGNEMSSQNLSLSNQTPDLNINPSHVNPNGRRSFAYPTPSQPTRASSYQAIEAAYLEHGIRIHLNPSAVGVVSQQPNPSSENLNPRKVVNGIQRHKAFINRIPSRASSAFDFPPTVHDMQQDSRPFSALQQTSTEDFNQTTSNNHAYIPTNGTSHALQLANPFCSSTILASEQADHILFHNNQLAITNGTTSTETLVNNDPDLAYMSSLLQTASGDSFRDTIRRRAGLRATFAVHRNPQYSTAPTSKLSEKSSATHASPMDHRGSLLRTSTIAVVPTSTTPSSKRIEKDILKHASRIRTNQIRDPLFRYQQTEQTPSIPNSPTRIQPPRYHRSKTVKPSKTISLEPLELLLAPSSHSIPSPPARSTSLTLHTRPMTIYRDHSSEQLRTSRKRSKSPKISFVEKNKLITPVLPPNEPVNTLHLIDDGLSLMKTSPLDLLPKHQIHPSTSSDSGYYDQSSSADTHSITSSSIHRASSSIPSARLTSANTRRSNINKKVSFEDQFSTIIVTTATYV